MLEGDNCYGIKMKLKQVIEKVRCMETSLKQGLILNKRCEGWCISSDIRMSNQSRNKNNLPTT